jgi:branched-chain amino acid transport system substrate-binding protein
MEDIYPMVARRWKSKALCVVSAVALGVVASACSSSSNNAGSKSGGSSTTSSGPPIKIGILLALSGPTSPGDAAAVQAATARVDAVNAAGGINGRKVQLVSADSQGTSQGSLTAAQSLVSQGVVAVIGMVPPFEGPAEQYISGHGIPMVEAANDTALDSDSNLFSVVGWSGGSLPSSTSVGTFLKQQGVKSVAGVAWGSIAPSVSILDGLLAGTNAVGIKTAIQDLTPAPTTVDFTSDALKIKNSGAQAVLPEMAGTQALALAQALQQQDASATSLFGSSILEKSTLAAPGASSLSGYIQYWFAPPELGTPGTQAMNSTLQKYEPGVFGGYLEEWAYVSADLLITGLQKVSGSVSASSLKSALSSISSYNADGLIPTTLNFTAPKSATNNLQRCFYYPKMENGQFTIAQGAKPVCGSLIPAS